MCRASISFCCHFSLERTIFVSSRSLPVVGLQWR
jgi:hypothetical protein